MAPKSTNQPKRLFERYYSKQERMDILECFRESGCKLNIARQIYINRYPTRRKPTRHVINYFAKKLTTMDYEQKQNTKICTFEYSDSEETLSGTEIIDVEESVRNRQPAEYTAAIQSQIHPHLVDRGVEFVPETIDLDEEATNYNSLSPQMVVTSEMTQPVPVKIDTSTWRKPKPYLDVFVDPHTIQLEDDSWSINKIESVDVDAISEPESVKTIENSYMDGSITIESDDSINFIDSYNIIAAKRPRRKQRKKIKKTKEKKVEDHAYTLRKKVRQRICNEIITSKNSLIVCTKRLEDMCVMQRDISQMDRGDLIETILEESRTDYPFVKCDCCVNHSNKIEFHELVSKLKILTKLRITLGNKLGNPMINTMDYEPLVDINNVSKSYKASGSKILPLTNVSDFDNLTYNVISVSSDEDEPLEQLKRRRTDYDINVNLISEVRTEFRSDLLIVIKNVYLDDSPVDTYFISNDNIEEYQIVNLNDTKAFTEICDPNNHKQITRFDCCCWFKRQSIINKHFDKRPFSRFMCRPHECNIETCKCCCAPESANLKSSSDNLIKVRTDLMTPFNPNLNYGLFLRAFKYKRTNKKGNLYIPRKKLPLYANKLICLTIGMEKDVWSEQIGLDTYGDIDFYTLDKNNPLKFAKRICCVPYRSKILTSLSTLSSRSGMFLKKSLPPLTSKCFKGCQFSDSVIVQQSKKFKLFEPKIQHMRSHVVAKFVTVRQTNEVISDYNIYKCIDMVLTHFKGVTFSMKEDKSILASVLTLAPNKVSYAHMSYLKQVLMYMKNVVEPLNLPAQTQLYIEKNNTNSYVITTTLNNIVKNNPLNTVIETPVNIRKNKNIQNTGNVISENVTVVVNESLLASLASQSANIASSSTETMPTNAIDSTQTNSIYESFSKIIYSNKCSYNNVFLSFLRLKDELSVEEGLSLPIISSVFTLSNADKGKTQVYEDLERNIPSSTINKADTDVLLPNVNFSNGSLESQSRVLSNENNQAKLNILTHTDASTVTESILGNILTRKKSLS